MPWGFLNEPNWVQRARYPSQRINGNKIQTNIIDSIRTMMHQVGGVAQDHQRTYYGHYFLQDQDGPIQPGGQPIDRAAWFGFVDTGRWLRHYNRGHLSELVIAYRRHDQYRLDGVQFNDRFVCVGADPLFCGRHNVPNQIAWIADFDETWDQDVWTEIFGLFGNSRYH